MNKRYFRLGLILVVLLCMSSAMITANATYNFADDFNVSIAPGYAIYKGIWIANSQENAFLLLGSEEENVMKVAVASQSDDGQYQIVALSEGIITYDEYRDDLVQLLDHWDDGHPYFWYENREYKDVYIVVEESDDGWEVSSGYIAYYENDSKFSFYTTETPNEIVVYGTTPSPQIYWPLEASVLSLDQFDINIIESACIEALGYLRGFQSSQHDDQDHQYKIEWAE